MPPHGKFSALQSLENSQNAEGISILPEPAARAAERAACMSKARRAVRVPPDPGLLDPTRAFTGIVGWLDRDRQEGNFPPCKALKTHKM